MPHKRTSVVFLPTVLLLGGLITVIVLTVSLVVYLVGSGNYGVRLSFQASAAARAGVDDGLLRLLRTNVFVSDGYTVQVGDGKAVVKISLVGGTADYDDKEIIADGCSQNRYRRLKAAVRLDKISGKLQLVSLAEEPLVTSLVSCP